MNKLIEKIKNTIEHIGKDKILLANNIYLRVLSILCLFFGCWFWLRLVGVYSGNLWRIDLMPGQWQFLTTALAVICPVAAIGLWFGALWGIILWVISTITQIVAFTIYSYQFEFMPFISLLHIILLCLFLAFNVIIFFKKRQKSVVLTEF